MPNGTWKSPIEIQLGVGTRKVSGPFDAFIYLTDNWPNRSGPHFIRAQLACRAAMEGRLEMEAARQDFIEAAKEAHLYLN
jgi:hypothetical protein